MNNKYFITTSMLLLLIFCFSPYAVLSADTLYPKVKKITVLTKSGGRVNWSAKGDVIAFDRKGSNGYYDIWTINSDGSNENCLTCDKSGVPELNNGNPAWHPSGEFVVFTAQSANLWSPFYEKWATSPGGGINNNLWLVNKEGTKFWQLTSVKNRGGVIHPHFSHDGTKLLWAERVSPRPFFWGQWAIKLADFIVENGEPKIGKITELKPGDMGLYETHGFSPDDSKITFSAAKRRAPAQGFDEFIYDIKSGELTNLTNTPKEWDEFAQFTPDGKYIVWDTSMGTDQKRNRKGDITPNQVKLEYWIMNPDGSSKERLTHFNVPGYPEYRPNGVSCAVFSFNPDGSKFVAKIRALPARYDENEQIIIVELEK